MQQYFLSTVTLLQQHTSTSYSSYTLVPTDRVSSSPFSPLISSNHHSILVSLWGMWVYVWCECGMCVWCGVCVCVCTPECIPVSLCGGQKTILDIGPCSILSETRFHLLLFPDVYTMPVSLLGLPALPLISLQEYWNSRCVPLISLHLTTGIPDVCSSPWPYVCSEDFIRGPPACMARELPTEPPPQPQFTSRTSIV